MRAWRLAPLLAVPAAAGCLSAPTGKPQTWPPDGVTISAITVGDFDGDGTDDVAFVATGTAAAGAGIYVARGGVDVDVRAQPIASFSYVAFADLQAPVAAMPADLGGPGDDLLVGHVDGNDVVLTGFQGDTLAVLGDTTVSIPGGASGIPGIGFATGAFQGIDERLFVTAGDQIEHLPVDGILDSPMIGMLPAPMGEPNWGHPYAVATFTSGGVHLVVASEQDVWTAALPTSEPPEFVWSTVRSAGAWTGQITRDLTGDDVPEVLGFNPMGAAPGKLCIYDVLTDAEPCLDTMINADAGVDVRDDQLTPDPDFDGVVIQHAPENTQVTILPNLTFNGATASSMPALPAIAVPVKDALVTTYPGPSAAVLLFVGPDGSQSCVHFTGSDFDLCDGD